MATSERRRGPAPIASFDHDVSDESSPETKQTFQLPEIREDSSAIGTSGASGANGTNDSTGASGASKSVLGVIGAEGRARSHSTPGLGASAAPRIDISRASSSSHHDSRDSSPEMALFAGADDRPDHLGFREDGTQDLRSSTEELAFLEPTTSAPPAPPAPAPPAIATPARRHSRKDSQGSEAALLAIGGRTSRLSSIGSQCSAQSALSHVSRLSVVSGTSRSPSPHKMLLETSFCGPKPIETDPEVCAAAVEERLLEIAGIPPPPAAAAAPPDARDHREVRTEATVEVPPPRATAPTITTAPPALAVTPAVTAPDDEKLAKETRNRRARSRDRRDRSEPEVYKSRNRSKDVIRIKLKPDESDSGSSSEDDCVETSARKPDSLSLGGERQPQQRPAPARSPSPAPHLPSRKSSFCSLFKSRETIASPDSPSDALRRKKSLNDGRSRSKSRERSAPPASGGKRGSVLSLFKTPRRSAATSPAVSRAASPQPVAQPTSVPPPPAMRGLKYYEDTRDGIIHIPLRTPPGETPVEPRERPASAPCARPEPLPSIPVAAPPPPSAPPKKPQPPLPDGIIIIPLHSPTERTPPSPLRSTLQRENKQKSVSEPRTPAVVSSPPSSTVRSPPASVIRSPPSSTVRSPPSSIVRTPPSSTARSPPSSIVRSRPSSATPPTPATPATPATPVTPATPAPVEATTDGTRTRRKERLVFTTHVGSTEQVFSTQFSITKTPSVTSEISESFPSLPDEARAAPACPVLRDTRIGQTMDELTTEAGGNRERASSESENSSEAGTTGATATSGADAEARGLVVQESFEEELPYVPTTLPLERSLALPMLPVRDRGPQLTATVASVERPRSGSIRGPLAPPPPLPPAPAPAPPPQERLRIRLPRRATAPNVAPADKPQTIARPSRSRTRSGSGSGESRKSDWIDFSEVPERRPAARRIQTLPRSPPEEPVSYVEPEHCRCECHRTSDPTPDTDTNSGGEDGGGRRPFTADLDVHEDAAS